MTGPATFSLFHQKCFLILMLHSLRILHPLILFLMCLKIRCSSYLVKCAPFPSNKANCSHNLRHFRFNQFLSNKASLINNNRSLIVSGNHLLLLDFHQHPPHLLNYISSIFHHCFIMHIHCQMHMILLFLTII